MRLGGNKDKAYFENSFGFVWMLFGVMPGNLRYMDRFSF